MSMLAEFVQVDPALLDDPESFESLFVPELPAAFDPERMREAILARGPQLLAGAMDLHPQLRSQIEESLGRSQAALQRGDGGEAVFELMRRRMGGRDAGGHERLELDKAWHGVHFALSGTVEPGDSLVSQAVLGGTEAGEDFSGYGPARFFTAAQVTELAAALAEAEPQFDPERMNELEIYPFGWDEPDARDWIMTSFRELRDFYAGAAAKGRAIVTCLV
jgi:Domain of unknown function (DUF1877)